MANLRQIKRRIKSAKNIAQITRAMEMVAASKMKKAQNDAIMGKPYAEKIYQAVSDLSANIDKTVHPLLSEGNENGKKLVVLITTNKGLCGSLNTSLLRTFDKWASIMENLEAVILGKKGQSYIVRSKAGLIADFSVDVPWRNIIPAVNKICVEGFIKGTYREVYLVYNTFFTVMKQIPTIKRILPITALEKTDSDANSKKRINFREFLIEPSINEVLENLLPHYIENQIRTAVLEAEASEHSARMIAMKNASDAALDLMDSLTLMFNRARQEKITFEIADMVTARMAVD